MMEICCFLKILILSFSVLSVSAQGDVRAQSNGDLRLAVDGLSTGQFTSGRLQVYFFGQWGNICDNGFGIQEAHVACHQLGYDGALRHSNGRSDSYGVDDHPALLSSINCTNNDSLHILQCSYSTVADCSNDNEVSIDCSLVPIWTNPHRGAVRLVDGGGYSSDGRLEIYLSSWNTLCDNGFGSGEANTACRQLGYTYARHWNYRDDIDGRNDRTTQYTCCTGSNDCLTDCYCSENNNAATKKRDIFCDHSDDVTLQCGFDTDNTHSAGTRNQCDFTARNRIIAIVLGTVFGFIGLVILCIFGCAGLIILCAVCPCCE